MARYTRSADPIVNTDMRLTYITEIIIPGVRENGAAEWHFSNIDYQLVMSQSRREVRQLGRMEESYPPSLYENIVFLRNKHALYKPYIGRSEQFSYIILS